MCFWLFRQKDLFDSPIASPSKGQKRFSGNKGQLLSLTLEPGQLCLVNYGERPKLFHVRILLAPTTVDNWVVLTPDMDTYEEQMSALNTDFTEFIYLGPNPTIPAHIPANQVYGFAPMSPGTLAGYLASGKIMANAIRANQGLPALGQVPQAAGAPVAPVAAVAAPPAVAGQVWVAVENCEDRKRGDIICVEPNPLPAGSVALDDHAVVPSLHGGGKPCFAKRVSAQEAPNHALDDPAYCQSNLTNKGSVAESSVKQLPQWWMASHKVGDCSCIHGGPNFIPQLG